MKYKYLIYLLITTFSILSCSSDSSSESDYSIEGQTEDGFEDGTYCAEVEYSNPNTGTNNTYTLEVEVYSNQVTQINWGNGGWIDEDHFSAEDLDSDGMCSFTSDKGYEYTVRIIGRDCSFTDESNFQSDVEEDETVSTCPECGDEKNENDEYCYSCKEELTCPKCGSEKDSYDDYCDNCTDRQEHTCERCGQYDSFMFSSDDLCSDCERKEDE
jgi:hypothetical protein